MSEPTTSEKGIGSMVKAQVVLGNTGLQLRNIDELFRFAQAVAGSSLAPKDFVGRPESVLVAIQMGMEIGLPPMAALQNIAVINGRPSVWGDAQLAVVRSTGELEAFEETETNNEIELIFRELCFEEDAAKRKVLKIQIAKAQANIKKDADDYGVSCFVKRKGFNEAFSRFTVSDAKTAGLWKKQGPWTNYPSRMLKSRARSFLLRDQFGDALKGMMSREEAGDIIDITGVTSDVPRAEAAPGPEMTRAPFRRGEKPNTVIASVADHISVKDSTGALHSVPVPQGSTAADCERIGKAALEAIENQLAEGQAGLAPAGSVKTPDNVIDINAKEVAPDPQKAAVEPTAPAAESTSTAQTSATTAQTSASDVKPVESKPKKEPFVLPPSKMPEGWHPNPEDISKSFFEWCSGEEIAPEEIIKWCMSGGRGYAKAGQKVSDLSTSKLSGILKIREQVRKDILEARQ